MEEIIKISVVMAGPGIAIGLMLAKRRYLMTEENVMQWAMMVSVIFAIIFY